MIELRMLGAVSVIPAGASGPSSLIAQPRRFALLAYLASATPYGMHRRDKLLTLFWPELDQKHARAALREALRVLRSVLGPDALTSLGDEEVGLDAAHAWCDVRAFAQGITAGEIERSLELYRGDLLEGFYIPGAPEFERWLEDERARLREVAAAGARTLAGRAEAQGELGAAVQWTRRALRIAPLDEAAVRRLVSQLDQLGDRAGAVQVYEGFAARLARELQVEPAAETQALIAVVRASDRVAGTAPEGSSIVLAPPVKPSAGVVETRRVLALGSPTRWRRRGAVTGLGVLGLALVLVLGTRLRGRSANSHPPEPSLAVLPLRNLGTDPGDASLADGLTMEFIAMVAKTGRLRVIASTSAFAFKNSTLDVRQIAESLHVTHVLEGGLQHLGSRLRVQVRLIDARDGTTRWSEVYDRELSDVFTVEDNIAGAVARELDIRLGGGARANVLRHGTKNIVAYEWFLRGNDPLLFRSDSGLYRSLDYFTRAIEADSTYAAAYAGLAYRYTVLGSGGGQEPPARDLFERAERAASKAVALDDSLGEAHTALGFARMFLLDLASAERELERALALDPSGELTQQVVIYLYSWTARPAEALALARRALNDDLLSAVASAELAHAYLLNRRYDSALAQLHRIADIHPPLRRAAMYAAICYINKGMWREAIAQLRPALLRPGQRGPGLLGYALARAGQRVEANRILEALLVRWQRSGDDAFWVATVYAGLGDMDRAFTWLDRSVEDLSFRPNLVDEVLHEVAADPRYHRIRRRVGIQN